MLITAVIFSCLALNLPARVFGQTFCEGGVLPCVANANCNAGTDKCQCDATFSGNGRVSCNPSTSRCTCTALADPHFGLFDTQAAAQQVTANLACSVDLVASTFVTAPASCLITAITAHPEIRGTGAAANLRVFVKQIQAQLNLPITTFTLDSTGLTATTGSALVVSGTNADNFLTATVASCNDLQIGFNSTYGGAFVNTVAFTYGAGGLCGDCDNTADEPIGATNSTNLGYYMSKLSATQVGPFQTECGSLKTIVDALCTTTAELDQAGDICGRYLDNFGICLIEDATVTTVPDFNSLLTTKFQACVTNVCQGSLAAACTALTGDATAACAVGAAPASCP